MEAMKKCIVCGNPYTSSGRRKYCSNACRKLQWKLTNREAYLAGVARYRAKLEADRCERGSVVLACEYCGKKFEQNKYHPEQKCCSHKCSRDLYKSTHKEKVTEWKRRERQNNKERYRKVNAVYKDKMRFNGNRLRALNRDEFTCQICGAEHLRVRLIVHHKDGSGQSTKPNNRIENLQTLCRACHARIHKH